MLEKFQRHKIMEIIAISKSIKISPRKVRLVADVIRKQEIAQALNSLSLIEKRSSGAIYKTLKSALSNALNNAKKKQEDLFIKRIEVSEGAALKRYRYSTRGRTHPFRRGSSDIKIVLEEKNYGTKS